MPAYKNRKIIAYRIYPGALPSREKVRKVGELVRYSGILEPDHEWYKMSDGRIFGAHKRSCFFCVHCTDIIYDYTHGPYAFICDHPEHVLDDTENSFEGKCPHFKKEVE